MIKKELLDILNCPKCKGPLIATTDENNHRNGQLICRHCHLAFAVNDGLPNMGLDDAKRLEDPPNNTPQL